MTDHPNLKPEDCALIELKPCPFCGGEGSINLERHGFASAIVECTTCYSEGPLASDPSKTGNQNAVDAITAWNRRSPGGEINRNALSDNGLSAVGDSKEIDLNWPEIAEDRGRIAADLGARLTLAQMTIENAVDVLASRGRFGSPDDALANLQSTLTAIRGAETPAVSSPPSSGEVREASPDLLAWLADHRRLELEYGYDDEFEAMFWRVHERSGNVNDREWDLIGQGETPLAALLSAKSYLEAKSADLTA